MRIRKRQIPLPFSSISPVPLSSSDPNFNRPPVTVVQLPLRQQQQPPPPHYPSESDHHHHPDQPIGQPLPTHTRDSSALHGTTQVMNNKQDYPALNPGEEDEEKKKNNDTRKKTILGAKLGTGSNSSSSHYQGGWGEGEKAFPLKKRRGSVETRGADEVEDVNNGGMMIMAKDTSNKKPMKSVLGKNMKTKLNKKLVSSNEEESKDIACTSVDNDNNANSNTNNDGGGGAKKRGRGGALMEGSRCSRVNGRGWRCCQQTLVGYSLCEHHLGKGRLRSITSVRNRAKEDRMQANKNVDHDHQGTPVLSDDVGQPLGKQTKGELHDDNDAEGEEKKPLTTMTKKRVKLGLVKARSMSSLLGQNDNNGIAVVADDGN